VTFSLNNGVDCFGAVAAITGANQSSPLLTYGSDLNKASPSVTQTVRPGGIVFGMWVDNRDSGDTGSWSYSETQLDRTRETDKAPWESMGWGYKLIGSTTSIQTGHGGSFDVTDYVAVAIQPGISGGSFWWF